MRHEVSDVAKQIGDWTSAGVTVAVVLSWLPTVASILTVIWFAIRIAESQFFHACMAHIFKFDMKEWLDGKISRKPSE